MSAKPAGSYAFKVPNNRTGRRFLALAREYAYRPEVSRIRVRGSGAGNGRRTPWGDLPIAHAESLRVYLDTASAAAMLSRVYAAEHEKRDAEYAHDDARIRAATAANDRDHWSAQYHEAAKRGGELSAELATIPTWVRRVCAWLNKKLAK